MDATTSTSPGIDEHDSAQDRVVAEASARRQDAFPCFLDRGSRNADHDLDFNLGNRLVAA